MEKCEGGIVRRERRESERVGHKGMYVHFKHTHAHHSLVPCGESPSSIYFCYSLHKHCTMTEMVEGSGHVGLTIYLNIHLTLHLQSSCCLVCVCGPITVHVASHTCHHCSTVQCNHIVESNSAGHLHEGSGRGLCHQGLLPNSVRGSHS